MRTHPSVYIYIYTYAYIYIYIYILLLGAVYPCLLICSLRGLEQFTQILHATLQNSCPTCDPKVYEAHVASLTPLQLGCSVYYAFFDEFVAPSYFKKNPPPRPRAQWPRA